MKTAEATNYREAIKALLETEQLPADDLPLTLDNFIVALDAEQLIAVAGLEPYSHYGLLRSLAVDKAHRGKGIADGLVKQIEAMAASKQLRALFLLTETAAGYFSRKGYQTISRAEVPAAIQASTEFGHVCPTSATVMVKSLM